MRGTKTPSPSGSAKADRSRGRAVHAAALGAVVAGVLVGWADPAQSSGYALREGSADWMANAFAGDASKAYDAATVWSNPAGMVRLNQTEIDGSLDGIFPTVSFRGANTVGSTATPGTTGGNLIQSTATAGEFGVWNFSPDLKFGAGLTAPFGERIANPQNFVGRYQSLVSSLTDVALNLAAAYRVNDQISVGGGPVFDYLSARVTQAINTGPTAALTGDPVGDVHGHDISAGFNVGALYQATPDLRFGLDYRSRIQHGITGTQSIFIPPQLQALSPAAAAALASLDTGVRTKITLPDIATASATWQATPQLALLASVEWTDWSLFQSVNITPTTPGVPGTVIAENWRNTWFFSVGANYRITDKLMLQGGVGYDESPVTPANRTTRIPDSNRTLLSIGAQYDVLPNVTVQVAYSHVFFADAPIDNAASSTSGIIAGEYSVSADTASLGAKIKF
jgi:long-chain fatty acid transport protein